MAGVAVLASTLAAVGLSGAPAQAIPACKAGYQCSRTYYADSAWTVVVGGFTRFCDGSLDQWGETTRYVETTQVQCPR
ncbi:hypothetical protein EKG83_28090 [Saccharothrix syringae]|uniref:Uncharacterized protein n=1 Tax=Saccharothrix syringae TaxID=103733 RepID=A0A5Q0H3E5_SACSY|nr:hypothetical protein EKG83_28090 [Saccharothrix syringae]